MSNEQYYTTPRELLRGCMVTPPAHGLMGFRVIGLIGNTSIIGEIAMNPYISGQNSVKFRGKEICRLT